MDSNANDNNNNNPKSSHAKEYPSSKTNAPHPQKYSPQLQNPKNNPSEYSPQTKIHPSSSEYASQPTTTTTTREYSSPHQGHNQKNILSNGSSDDEKYIPPSSTNRNKLLPHQNSTNDSHGYDSSTINNHPYSHILNPKQKAHHVNTASAGNPSHFPSHHATSNSMHDMMYHLGRRQSTPTTTHSGEINAYRSPSMTSQQSHQPNGGSSSMKVTCFSFWMLLAK